MSANILYIRAQEFRLVLFDSPGVAIHKVVLVAIHYHPAVNVALKAVHQGGGIFVETSFLAGAGCGEEYC